MSYKPFGDRILIKPSNKEGINKENTSMPSMRPMGMCEPCTDKIEEECYSGTVLAVGSGSKEEPMKIKIGQIVYYEKWAGLHLEIDKEDYCIIRQYNVIMTKDGIAD